MSVIVEMNFSSDDCRGTVTPRQINHRFDTIDEAVEWVSSSILVSAWVVDGNARIVPDDGRECHGDRFDVGLFGLE